ncbi:hypothetical protein C7S14_8383 [Burkholderia cepacia]|nr:hypothetical protein C7S14_8383 [Burkholderia cepacia]
MTDTQCKPLEIDESPIKGPVDAVIGNDTTRLFPISLDFPLHLWCIQLEILTILASEPQRLAAPSTPHCATLGIEVFRLDFPSPVCRKQIFRVEVKLFDRKEDLDENLVTNEFTIPRNLRFQL